MIRKLIPAVLPLYVLIGFILAILGHFIPAFILLLIPLLVLFYIAAEVSLPIDAIAEKLEGRQRD